MSEKVDPTGACLIGWAFLTPAQKAELARIEKYQKEVIQIMTVLPGKHRYAQVEAAINASGMSPRDIYECLAANERTFALQRFYEALNGPGWDKR